MARVKITAADASRYSFPVLPNIAVMYFSFCHPHDLFPPILVQRQPASLLSYAEYTLITDLYSIQTQANVPGYHEFSDSSTLFLLQDG